MQVVEGHLQQIKDKPMELTKFFSVIDDLKEKYMSTANFQ